MLHIYKTNDMVFITICNWVACILLNAHYFKYFANCKIFFNTNNFSSRYHNFFRNTVREFENTIYVFVFRVVNFSTFISCPIKSCEALLQSVLLQIQKSFLNRISQLMHVLIHLMYE